MRLAWKALFSVLVLTAPAAARGEDAGLRADMLEIVQQGMQPKAVDGLRERRRSELSNDSDADTTLTAIEQFSEKFARLKTADKTAADEAQALEGDLDTILDRLELEDPALKSAYMSQIAPPAEVQEEINDRLKALEQGLDDDGKREDYQGRIDEVRSLMSGGSWKAASKKFNSMFDRMRSGASSEVRGNGNVIRRALAPHKIGDANQFTRYRGSLARGLHMIDVPIPYSERKQHSFDAVEGGAGIAKTLTVGGAAAATAGVASAAGVVTLPASGLMIASGLGALGLGGMALWGFRKWQKGIVENPEAKKKPWE